jgi:hypothetical protein
VLQAGGDDGAGGDERAADRVRAEERSVISGPLDLLLLDQQRRRIRILTAVDEDLLPRREPDEEPAFVVAVVEPLRA